MLSKNSPELRADLERLTDGFFIRDGCIWRTVDMHGHGSDIDEIVSKDENDPAYVRQMTAWRLLQILSKMCKNGEPHRMRDVPATRRCVECGKEERP